MRVSILLVALSAAYIASAVPLAEIEGVKEYPRFINFPDGDNNMHLVDLEAEPDMELLAEIQRNPANNLYVLFTRSNPNSGQVLVMGDADSILNSNFNPNNPTVVIAHGWLSNQESDINPVITAAHLGRSDVNVIVLDWRRLAISIYTTAVRGVPDVGRGLGQFIRFLSETTGANLSDFHLVGFSLGAHVVGNAGRELGGQVARVTGLDPAGPLWVFNSNRINSNDAVYVEGIHTNGGLDGLGLGSDIGDADFYPNGGSSQPGCITPICDHNRAWQFYAASVSYNHLIGKQCSNSLQVTLGTCRGSELAMGNDDLRKYGTGRYGLSTRRRYPY